VRCAALGRASRCGLLALAVAALERRRRRRRLALLLLRLTASLAAALLSQIAGPRAPPLALLCLGLLLKFPRTSAPPAAQEQKRNEKGARTNTEEQIANISLNTPPIKSKIEP